MGPIFFPRWAPADQPPSPLRLPRSHVWMWHAMMGFWAGVAPASEAPGMAKYGARVSLQCCFVSLVQVGAMKCNPRRRRQPWAKIGRPVGYMLHCSRLRHLVRPPAACCVQQAGGVVGTDVAPQLPAHELGPASPHSSATYSALQVVGPQPTPATLEIDPSYAWVQASRLQCLQCLQCHL